MLKSLAGQDTGPKLWSRASLRETRVDPSAVEIVNAFAPRVIGVDENGYAEDEAKVVPWAQMSTRPRA